MNNENKSILFAGIAILSWSTVASAFKIALRYLTFFELLFVACLTALFILSVVMTFQKKWSLLLRISKTEWMQYGFMGLISPTVYYMILFHAYNLLPAQVAQPINYSWPIFLLVLLAFIDKKVIPPMKYVGLLLSLAGVALISLGTSGLGGVSLSLTGILLALLSALLWAIYWIMNNRKRETDHTVGLFLGFFFGSLYLLVLSLFIGVNFLPISGLMAGMYVGAFEMAIPFLFFGLALRNTNNPVLINQLCYLSPFISLFFIHIVLSEQICLSTYIGLSMIITGIVFNHYLIRVVPDL